jgi:hypothetical protein
MGARRPAGRSDPRSIVAVFGHGSCVYRGRRCSLRVLVFSRQLAPSVLPRSPTGPWTGPSPWTTAMPSSRPWGWSISADVRSPATVAVRRSRGRLPGRLPRLRDRPAPGQARRVRRQSPWPPFRGEAYASCRSRRDSKRPGRRDADGDVTEVNHVTAEVSLAPGCAPMVAVLLGRLADRHRTAQPPGNSTLRYGTSTTPGKSGREFRTAGPGSFT